MGGMGSVTNGCGDQLYLDEIDGSVWVTVEGGFGERPRVFRLYGDILEDLSALIERAKANLDH